jgi:hypothetical protein
MSQSEVCWVFQIGWITRHRKTLLSIIVTRQYYANRRFISIVDGMPKDGFLNLYQLQSRQI